MYIIVVYEKKSIIRTFLRYEMSINATTLYRERIALYDVVCSRIKQIKITRLNTYQNFVITRLLLQQKTNVRIKTLKNETIFHRVVAIEYINVIKLLFDYEIDIEYQYRYLISFIMIVHEYRNNTTQILLKQDFNVNMKMLYIIVQTIIEKNLEIYDVSYTFFTIKFIYF